MSERPVQLNESPDAETAQQRHQQSLSKRTHTEQEDLLQAMHRLEAALASPAPNREENWAARVGKDLAVVQRALKSHVDSAEGPNGLLEELIRSSPRMQRRVENLRAEHQRLLLIAANLALGLQAGPPHNFAALRREATALLNALRHDHATEVDLIYECFWLDIGVGD
jgi:hypothetical protein